ncbi:VWA domain-containing protein, partial [bacterium]|nr:VWA domain-containing protein [bacterium]
MNRKKRTNAILHNFCCIAFFSVLIGCGGERIPPTFKAFEAVDLSDKFSEGGNTGKIDNFLVIMDASSTMNKRYLYEAFDSSIIPTLFEVQKELLKRLNQTIPAMKLNAGIRTFGFGPCQSWRFSLELLKLGNYDKKSFNDALDSIECAGGGSPADFAIDQAGVDIESAKGNTGIIIISDGDMDDAAAVAVFELKKQYRERICVHTIAIGQNPAYRLAMRRLSALSGCGY